MPVLTSIAVLAMATVCLLLAIRYHRPYRRLAKRISLFGAVLGPLVWFYFGDFHTMVSFFTVAVALLVLRWDRGFNGHPDSPLWGRTWTGAAQYLEEMKRERRYNEQFTALTKEDAELRKFAARRWRWLLIKWRTNLLRNL